MKKNSTTPSAPHVLSSVQLDAVIGGVADVVPIKTVVFKPGGFFGGKETRVPVE